MANTDPDLQKHRERLQKRGLGEGTVNFYMAAFVALRRDPQVLERIDERRRRAFELYLLDELNPSLKACGEQMHLSGGHMRELVAQAVDLLRRGGARRSPILYSYPLIERALH